MDTQDVLGVEGLWRAERELAQMHFDLDNAARGLRHHAIDSPAGRERFRAVHQDVLRWVVSTTPAWNTPPRLHLERAMRIVDAAAAETA